MLGLKSATWYRFRVRAANSYGLGEWSAKYDEQTEDETEPKQILGVDACPVAPFKTYLTDTNLATNSIALTWATTPPYQVNEIITSSSTIDISGLAADTEYKVKSVAGNAIVLVPSATADEDVAAIYKENYWDRIKGDSLPSGVDWSVFDWCVNSG